MKYALIGCGRISPNHIVAAEENGLEIVAVCDVVSQNAIDSLKYLTKQKAENIKIYSDYKTMLKEIKPQLVAVATESGKHFNIGMDCLNAGCNVIIEKPIALSIADADDLNKKADEKNLKLCACHQNRFNKSIQKVRKAVEENKLGELMYGTAHIRWNRRRDYYEQAKWRGTWAQDGGSLMNQCIHNIDLLRWMMGDEITEVTAYTDNLDHDYIEAEDFGIAVVKFKNKRYGIIEGTTVVYPKNLEETLYLFGKTGTVKVGGKSVNVIEEWVTADKTESREEILNTFNENPPNVYGFGHTPLYADMIDSIVNNRTPYVDGYAGKRALELVLAIYESAATGKTVKFPLKKGATIDYAGRKF